MKFSKTAKKRIYTGFAVLLALFVWISCKQSMNAADSVSSEEVLSDTFAGAANVLDKDTVPSDEEIEIIVKEKNAWKAPGSLVMADVSNSVNVREEADSESTKVGYLYKDCGGYIKQYTDDWTLISSGNMEGWVNNDFLLFGDEAEALADDVGSLQATITGETLRVRKEPNLEAGIYGLIGQGEKFDVVREEEDWLVIEFEGAEGYINSEYADVEFHIDYGETVEEVTAREEAEKKAKREAERNKVYGKYAANASDAQLLGALIQCEAGNQPYEGKLAVGAVVLNRVRSGAYPNTLYGVIYASGQFTPAGSGAVDKRIAQGVSDSCLQAATEAINGKSNIGAATHFRPASTGHDGIVIGGHVFW